MTIWGKLQPDYAANMWKEALNKRLGTKVCFNLFVCTSVICFQILAFCFVIFLPCGLAHNLISFHGTGH
jgi:hypothetical protein